ncbi:MAG TPA: hypothetical protein VF998_09685 [Candidatus Limnocylindria bacterium]
MKELLEGRRLGFALRPHIGQIAAGLGLATTLVDLMAWFGWGARDTNGFVIVAYWLVVATAIVAALAAVTSFAELIDAEEDDRILARLDLLAVAVVTALYAVSAVLRSGDLGAAGASPFAFLTAVAALLILLVDGVVAATLYSAREWAVPDEEEYEPRRHQRRRRAS